MKDKLQINYLLWGASSTIINLIIFKIFFSFSQNLVLTVLIYYLIGTLIKFLGYKYFVFKKKMLHSFINQLIKYAIFVFFIIYLNYYFLEIVFEMTNIQYFYIQVIWILIFTPLSYFISKLIIFK